MAMPMGYTPGDAPEEKADSVQDYKITCMNFIEEISADYKAWVDYYKLPREEDSKRRREIDSVISRTNQWIAKVPQSIKGVDVVMNDGIQKMAEATAGRPFQIGVFISGTAGYTSAAPGKVDVRVRAAGRNGRKTSLGFHFQDNRFRIESTCEARMDEAVPDGKYEMMDIGLALHADEAKPGDVASFTITVCEMDNEIETDRRGLTTIVHFR